MSSDVTVHEVINVGHACSKLCMHAYTHAQYIQYTPPLCNLMIITVYRL